MENVAEEQGLALQQHFPYKTSKFSENSNCRISLLFHSRGLKLGHFGILSISGILEVIAHNIKIL